MKRNTNTSSLKFGSAESEKAIRMYEEAQGKIAKLKQDQCIFASGVDQLHFHALPHINQSGPLLNALKLVAASLVQGRIACLFGIRGNGKTMIAIKIVVDSIRAHRRAKLIVLSEFLGKLRETFGTNDAISERRLFESNARYPLLCIDDLHEGPNSEYARRILTNLIDVRYRSVLPTLLISNHERAEDLAAALCDSAVSRIQERGDLIEAKWPSFRGDSGSKAVADAISRAGRSTAKQSP